MKILILTQVFYPDTVSVSQHLTDLAIELQKNGNIVSVISSKCNYEDKKITYSKFENLSGVKIFRIGQSRLGKKNIIYRLIDFFTFNLNLTLRLFFLRSKSYDIIIGTTVPPLISFLSAFISKMKNISFYFWVMDLQPELSIASGLINQGSLTQKFLSFCGKYTIRNSDKIFSLDRFMTEYLLSKGAQKENVFTIPVWPVIEDVYHGNRDQNPFRIQHEFGDKIVIMYSGNHAFVHPLDTLLDCAKLLANDDRFLFVFVGGGVRKSDVTFFKVKNKLNNILQLPFQPRENIHISLASSDLQVVILGDGQVGYTHPNKIYGALFVGKPVIYIGPNISHVTDILNKLSGNIIVSHGESLKLKNKLLQFVEYNEEIKIKIGNSNFKIANDVYNPIMLKRKMIKEICS